MAERALTPDEITVIRERYFGWEEARASTLAAVFGVSVQRINAIVHSSWPDTPSPSASGVAG